LRIHGWWMTFIVACHPHIIVGNYLNNRHRFLSFRRLGGMRWNPTPTSGFYYGSAVYNSRDAARNTVSLVEVENRDVGCGDLVRVKI
jgi:hypothetical protein